MMYYIYNFLLNVKLRMKIFYLIIYALLKEVIGNKYDRYKVYHVYPQTQSHLKLLEKMRNKPEYNFLTTFRILHRPTVVLTSPAADNEFKKTLKRNNMRFVRFENDVGSKLKKKYRMYRMGTPFSTRKFNSYQKITEYLWRLQHAHPDKVKVVTIGTTYEGRQILLVKIKKSSKKVGKTVELKPAIFIDAGIHAREWIAPATALYLIHHLVEGSSNEEMISTVDWYIAPLVNPDGYEYSLKVDRLWRKNRVKNTYCKGVDPNRNFAFHWNQGGSSDDECSEIYAGKKPFTESESIALRDFILRNQKHIKLYITLHSYGNLILYPWNYGPSKPGNHKELRMLARKVSQAIEKVYGKKYIYGTSYQVLYQASGNSEDWAKGVAHIPLSYAIELTGGGDTGFDISDKMIPIVGREMFAGFKAFWKYVTYKYKVIYDGHDK